MQLIQSGDFSDILQLLVHMWLYLKNMDLTITDLLRTTVLLCLLYWFVSEPEHS